MRHLQSLFRPSNGLSLYCIQSRDKSNVFKILSILFIANFLAIGEIKSITCPVMEDFYLADPDQCGAFVVVPTPSTDDPLWLDNITNDFNNTGNASGFYPIGRTTVTYTAVFTNGIVETCTIEVEVRDAQPVIINCPTMPSIPCFTDDLDLYPTFQEFVDAGGQVSDNCAIDPDSYRSSYEVISTNGTCMQTVEWTFSINDITGVAVRSCGFTQEFNDDQAPIINMVPQYDDLMCGDPLPALDPNAIVVIDNCMIDSIGVTRTPETALACDDTEYTYTWTVFDHCGNSTQASTNFMVLASSDLPMVDGTPIQINDINCDQLFPPFEILGAVHCTNATVETSMDFEVDVCNGYEVVYTWTPISECMVEGPEVEMIFNVLPDTEGPELEDPRPMVDIACGADLPDFEDLIAIDHCAEDDLAPEILGDCIDLNVCSRNSIDAEVPIIVQARDNCTSDENLLYSFNIDFNNDGSIDSTGNGTGAIIDLTDEYPIGTHRVDINYVDRASNPAACSIEFSISDCQGPSAACIPSVIVLEFYDSNNDGTNDMYGYVLNSTELNAGSFDNMGNPLTLSFSPDPNDQVLILDCRDRGEKDIFLYATDSNGNIDLCQTEILVLDGESQCGSLTGNGPFMRNELVCSEEVPVMTSVDPFVADPCGGYDVTYRYTATDYCGNMTEKISTFTVLPSKPEISAPADVIFTITDPSTCELEITLNPATQAMDLCSPIDFYQVDYPGGTLNTNGGTVTLPAGIHTVYYNATDECGNTCIDSSVVTIARPCLLACRELVNIAIGETCNATVVASMVGSDVPAACNGYYEVTSFDAHGQVIPDNIIDGDFVGETIKVEIRDPICNNTCWGYAFIEDKNAPEIQCQDPIDASCLNWDVVSLPIVTDNCNNYKINLTDEFQQTLPCNPDYSMIVFRTYVAEDIRNGLRSEACTQEIRVQRINLTDIVFPTDVNVTCTGLYPKDANGNPDPSLTGVPTLYGDDIFPVQTQDLCGTYVSYSDHILHEGTCQQKIVRTWEATEWWCNGDSTEIGVQFIQITDEEDPIIQCRLDTLIMTTNPHECIGYGYLPTISPVDNCSTEFDYFIEYTGGSTNINGAFVSMPIGLHNVQYTVYDDCLNSTSCNVVVEVRDQTPPIAACEQFKVVSLPSTGYVNVIAEVFDRGSRDECGIKLMSVRRMDTICNPMDTLWGPTVSFCCEDVDNEDLMVAFRVTDWAGNHNTCMVNVNVQDKVNPSFHCPEDVTVYCNEPYNFDELGLEFGNPTMSEVCRELQYTETVTRDIDQCGTGTIKREFELISNGISHICEQWITVLNNTQYDYTAIVWPESFTAEEACDVSNLNPDDLVHPFDKPYFPPGECDLIGVNYEDELFEFVPENDGCAKIHRTWTIINWCRRLENGSYEMVQHEQIIKTPKTDAPVITGSCDTVFICNEDLNCTPDSLLLFNTGIDDCTDVDDLRWTYKIDFFNTGVFDSIGRNDSIFEFFPYGEHLVRWELQDNCSNITTCEYIVDVRNCKPPTPVCLNGLAIELNPMDLFDANGDPGQDGVLDSEMVEIWAIDFEASSFHTCNNPFTFSFSQDTTDKVRVFDCDDIGLNVITMWVTDIYTGAQDFCETFVDVQDNNDVEICENIGGRADVYGYVITESNERIENVLVELKGTGSNMISTDDQGSYAFPSMPYGGQYSVEPQKLDGPLEGVSTLDLVLIQKHILGLERLTSPYKLIAADVNNDQSVSAIDLIELRKLILGVYADFPANDSWRFVYEDFEFPDPLQPWTTSIDESYDISNLSDNMEINFIGMKVGDVNATVGFGDQEDIDQRNNSKVGFKINEGLLSNGNTTLSFISTQDFDLDGFQMELLGLDFEGVHDISSSLIDIEFNNLFSANSNSLRMSYHEQDGISKPIKKGDVLFELELVEVHNQVSLASVSSNFRNELYSGEELFEITISQGREDSTYEAQLFQNAPNPWSQTTRIEFFIPSKGQVNLNIYDNSGRLLFIKNSFYESGYHIENINRNEIGTSGIIFYEMIFENQLLTKRMLLLD